MKPLLFFLAEAADMAVKEELHSGAPDDILYIGADGTPTRSIDRVAEEAILEALDSLGLDFNVLSEEAGFIDRGGEKTLVIDPLDGTYNALRKTGPFSVSIAIGKESTDDIEEAVVRDMVTGTVYYARKGAGAWRNYRPLKTVPFRHDNSVFSIYLGKMADERSHRLTAYPRRVRYFGCVSLELCFVAAGFLDACFISAETPRYNVRVVDVAAGVLMVREAGGEVYDADGKRFRLPFNLEERSSLLAVGDRRALEVLR